MVWLDAQRPRPPPGVQHVGPSAARVEPPDGQEPLPRPLDTGGVGTRTHRSINPTLTGRSATVVVRYCRSAAAGRMTATKTDTVTVSLRHAGACLPLSRDAHVKPPHFCIGWLMPRGWCLKKAGRRRRPGS